MPQFFIDRPVFAWVIAIMIVIAGLIAIPQLPVSRFPVIAPPSVSIYATYTGATPQVISDSVTSLIEREISGAKDVLYFDSAADSSGSATITVTFKPGTDPELAQVDIQNRLKAVEPRLPEQVRRAGLTVESASSGFLMIVSLKSKDGSLDALALDDYLVRNIAPELKRVAGVGRVQSFGSEAAMRIWLDPTRLLAHSISMAEVMQAIQSQNIQVAPGRLGDAPTVPGQKVSVPLNVRGQLQTPEEFAAVILRSNPDGSRLPLGEIARIEVGSQSSSFAILDGGKPATAAAIQVTPGANAVSTSSGVRARLAELALTMPAGIDYAISYDTAPFVKTSIQKVAQTLGEAMVLVFLIMLLFLQNIRYTLIPAIVAPIALLGTFAVMLALGYSINVLTMFGMVLAIGIIVDDAIVVVENVERLMATEGLSPRAATRKAMSEITGAVIGITLVLTAVFLPMGFASGSVGAIYRQFTVSMAVSILFSAFLALSLTPALCASLLKPVDSGHHQRKGFFGWFNRGFDRLTQRYTSWIARLVHKTGRVMFVYLTILGAVAYGYTTLATTFVPEEDQGSFMTSFTLPAEATAERTRDVVDLFEKHVQTRSDIVNNLTIMGFGFSGSGPNTAMSFTTLKDWDQRSTSVDEELNAAAEAMAAANEGEVFSLKPPAIEELGTTSGFSLRLQDRANHGEKALAAAAAQLTQLASQSKRLSDVRVDGLPSGPSVTLEVDRQKASALGIAYSMISDTLGGAVGSTYVNDFPRDGRLQQVIVQAEPASRMQVDDILNLHVRSDTGKMVHLSEIVTPEWATIPLQVTRYNGYPSISISGSAAQGVSSGHAMDEIEQLALTLPKGFAVEWTGQSLQERQSGAQAPMLMAFSFLIVFLVLAALYESWTVPLSVMLVVPLGVIGAVITVHLRGLENDVFFKVGLITLIGLSAKNAVLIVEFARKRQRDGQGLAEAVVEAARLRLRPIVMTSLAFTLGVVPLVIASGPSSETQNAIGTGLFGGMISGTVLAVFFVPVFYVVVTRFGRRRDRLQALSNDI
ncbi:MULTISPECIES: multidrug efflux RND transporter permease subunit [Alphaproteobacteria]|uniref:Efflux pump membrane transporter n=2 Tax=Alphaproteobacteria TaxID=28211 RepID=A0A512HD27_9HYPH|nr:MULTISPECIES: multidrug efflux RND transporter permease subunit [Alphaproteobacteria]GEO83357.1 multidrug efflux RND transporter permease subunit [Ciceribacter naphthalenivorans]GLR20249.1 multidrug efflux RND transporter permease subunit [Ciceribacter naphthalenivorans]GLT03105.1 multidrug efflux RND transporter permease subunit [Sphingomonas psychrolutea]